MAHVGMIIVLLPDLVSTCELMYGPYKYEPTWNSLAARSRPLWYDDAKIGILVHMGVYSVPGYSSEWFWWFWQGTEPPEDPQVKEYMKARYPAHWTYADFARDFTAELFNAAEWAAMISDSGAKYVVLTAKHHDGYALWPSAHSTSWNAMHVGPKRDLVGELALKARIFGLKFGVYYSLFEWFHPLYVEDKKNEFATYDYSMYKSQMELKDLVDRYSPEIIWADGDFAPDTYWNSTYFLAWLYTHKPFTVVNDRWGYGTSCKHGDFFTCGNRFNPGEKQLHKFENVFSLDNVSWGYRRSLDLHCVKTIEEILVEIVSTVACNGNVLINIGARSDGTIPPIFQERLKQMGEWFKLNSEAIHGSKPWGTVRDLQNPDVWYTEKPAMVFAFLTKWPVGAADEISTLTLGSVNRSMVAAVNQVWMLSSPPILLKHTYSGEGLAIDLPCFEFNNPAKWVWVIKIIVG